MLAAVSIASISLATAAVSRGRRTGADTVEEHLPTVGQRHEPGRRAVGRRRGADRGDRCENDLFGRMTDLFPFAGPGAFGCSGRGPGRLQRRHDEGQAGFGSRNLAHRNEFAGRVDQTAFEAMLRLVDRQRGAAIAA
jgi:hypothetical protein